MLSEELLLGVEGVDPESTFQEMVSIVDAYMEEHHGKPTHVYWENLADVAFLALRHSKPKVFRRAVELIGRIFSPDTNQFLENSGRACCLIADDAPEDPLVISYMLGHLKGSLRAYREACDAQPHGDFAQKSKQIVDHWMRRPVHSS